MTALLKLPGADGDTVPPTVEDHFKSFTPDMNKKTPETEPIEALARKGGFGGDGPDRPQDRGGLSFALWRGGVIGAVILFLILDFVLGITPLGKLLHLPGSVRPAAPQIVSVPAGASVYINDRYVGRTPRSVRQWPEGVTTVRLEYSGFAPAETILVVEKGQYPELPVFVLERRVSICSRPPGADIFIDGVPVSAGRAAGYPLRATDTISVEVRKAGLSAPPPLVLSATGPVGSHDSGRWLIDDRAGQAQLTLTGVFSREIMISSRPPGAAIFINGDTLAAGTTNQTLDLPLDALHITLRRPPFLDYTFEVEVTEDSPDRYSPALSRYVRISAVDADSHFEDIGAEIRWVCLGSRLIKSSDDRLRTPYSLNLEASDHEIMLAKKGYRDTLAILPAEVSAITVVMTPDEEAGFAPAAKEFRWVRFLVERSGKAVDEATVVGYKKDQRQQYEFGTTGEEGQLLVKVPPGKFSFVAIKERERSRVKDAKIKPGRKIKTITLKFH